MSKRRAKQTACFMAGKWKFRLMKIGVSLALRQRGDLSRPPQRGGGPGGQGWPREA